ncbi:MAG: phosphomannomutase/phosphoglucomutase [Candidatus Cloacimonetes bacterium]|nr:phosphomannomutase/phosphoglucomutase [Candidatus Cloacimonadota bacterium]MCF7814869.1 phosphomannomutase/phosphoglucomutase [Candidatus Cloacimonadota bacterium]MCF7867951.1 phosphomannomutase/phosphoglucomutase [Candidatus Cloacimonadota bacterium]MCF7883409.1 phosphomannomutase/phosphoglucomutase [Candidatus Cloacimonadota bacterium]
MVNPSIFRQYDIRGVVDKDLSNETLYLIGKGYGTYLRRLGGKTVSIGGDMRLSTPAFKENFIKGMREVGIDVTDIGICATPVLYYSIWKLKTDGGIMITASHNPAEYNGIKMNQGLQSVYGEQIQEILKLIQSEDFESGEGKLAYNDEMDESYKDYIVDNIKLERSVKVVVDGGNGAGGPYLPEILRRLGCEVKEIYCEPDGTFPNHHPDPTIEKYMTDLIDIMKTGEYEAGLGLDGDADRIGVIDEKGKMLYGDQILNIIARDFLKDNPGEKVIGDVKCSKNFFDDIKKHGGIPIMYKTGHANIKSKMQREGLKMSGEMSGHIFLKDRYLGFDDAIYVCARFVEIMSKTDMPVSQFLADQPKMYNTPEIKYPSTDDGKFEHVARVRDSFIKEGYDVNDIDGMRITFKDGWGLCRASNTTPVLVLRFEAETEERLEEIQKLITDRIEEMK